MRCYNVLEHQLAANFLGFLDITLTSSENHLRLIEIDDDGMKMMDHG